MNTTRTSVAALLAAVALVGAGCSGGDGLSQAELDDAVAAAVAEAIAELPESQMGVSAAEVDEAIASAIDDLVSSAGLSRAELDDAVADAVGGSDAMAADAPAKSDAAAYTKFVVSQAIDLYENEGLASMLDHVNSPDSVDDQWYVFVIDQDDTLIGHYDPSRLGQDMTGWVGTDVNGYFFGAEVLSATEAGKWVPYVYTNPASGTLGDEATFELKNAWVVRHDELLFGSGWHIDIEEFLPALIREAAEHFRAGGLDATLAFYSDPEGISTALIPTVSYYNRTPDALDGYFAGFIAGPDGRFLDHFDRDLVGTDIADLLGPAVRTATSAGRWITAAENPEGTGPQTMRVFAVDIDGAIIGGGWYRR